MLLSHSSKDQSCTISCGKGSPSNGSLRMRSVTVMQSFQNQNQGNITTQRCRDEPTTEEKGAVYQFGIAKAPSGLQPGQRKHRFYYAEEHAGVAGLSRRGSCAVQSFCLRFQHLLILTGVMLLQVIKRDRLFNSFRTPTQKDNTVILLMESNRPVVV